jgi:hypothetical protein
VITAFFFWLLGGLFIAVGMAFPHSDPSSTVDAATSGVGTVMGFASGFGIWLPFGAMGACAAVLVGVMLVGFAIRLIRIIASFLSGGGGSAA